MDNKEKVIQVRLFEIQRLIALDEVPNAINRAMDYVRDFSENDEKLHEIVLLSSQYNFNMKQMRLGLLEYKEVYTKRSQILMGILVLTKEIYDLTQIKKTS